MKITGPKSKYENTRPATKLREPGNGHSPCVEATKEIRRMKATTNRKTEHVVIFVVDACECDADPTCLFILICELFSEILVLLKKRKENDGQWLINWDQSPFIKGWKRGRGD